MIERIVLQQVEEEFATTDTTFLCPNLPLRVHPRPG